MKILQVCPYYYPHIGGVETYVYNLNRGFQKLGHEVSVITSDIPRGRSQIIHHVKVYRLPVLFKLFEAPFCPTLGYMLNRIKADITHVHMPPRFFADCTAIFHKISGSQRTRPLILSFHLYLERAPSLVGALSNVHYQTLSHFICDNCDNIIVATESYRDLLIEKFSIDSEKISVIPYGIDLNKFNPENFEKEEVRKRYNLSTEKIVLFVGRMDNQGYQQKGIKYLLRAVLLVVKEIKNVKFLIGGGGERINNLRNSCQKLGISSNVHFLGSFLHNKVPSLYSMADVFVLPSLFESFGITLAEAMAMEKPVVSTKIPGVVDVVENGKTGLLVEPQNEFELARAILEILSDENLANRFGKEGRKLVEKKYDWNLVLRETLKVYEEARAQI